MSSSGSGLGRALKWLREEEKAKRVYGKPEEKHESHAMAYEKEETEALHYMSFVTISVTCLKSRMAGGITGMALQEHDIV